MTTTRAAARRRAVFLARANGRSRGFSSRDGVNPLLATSGSGTSLIDTGGLPPAGAASTTGKGSWIYLPTMTAANQRRLVGGNVAYDGANQAISHPGPAWDATTITALLTGSTPYLILKDDPDQWNGALNEALQTFVSSIDYDEFTPTTSGEVHYPVASAPISQAGILRRTQILDLETHDIGDVSGQERWVPWANGYRTWEAYVDEGAVILDFKDPDRAPTTNDRMRIKWAQQFAVPATETETIATDELGLALATCVFMADWLADPDNASDDWNVIGARVRAQYATWRRLNLGPDAYRQVNRTAQQSGIARVRGRFGR